MSLPHVLLGLLHETPRTGYELARDLREEIDPSWTAGFSQIYPTLARLRRRHFAVVGVPFLFGTELDLAAVRRIAGHLERKI